jgi:hypothetical protein
VLRYPTIDSPDAQCPPLEELDKCDQSIKCAAYLIEWTNWGSCRLSDDSAICGHGRQQRYWQCVRALDNTVVDRAYCTSNVSIRALMHFTTGNCHFFLEFVYPGQLFFVTSSKKNNSKIIHTRFRSSAYLSACHVTSFSRDG